MIDQSDEISGQVTSARWLTSLLRRLALLQLLVVLFSLGLIHVIVRLGLVLGSLGLLFENGHRDVSEMKKWGLSGAYSVMKGNGSNGFQSGKAEIACINTVGKHFAMSLHSIYMAEI